MATIVGLKNGEEMIETSNHKWIEIVDGQQRITTLILLFKAIALTINNSTDDTHKKIRDEINKLLIKNDNATLLLLQTNHDSSDYFANYLKCGTHPSSKDAKTIADRELLAAMEECEKFVSGWTNGDIIELVKLLKNRLTFILHEIRDQAVVYTVFEVLNSRGRDVSWLDRLKSMLMAIIFENGTNGSEHIDTVHSLWRQIYSCVGLRLGLSTESLRFAATLRKPECPSRPLREEEAAYLLYDQSKDGPDKVIETTQWLKSVTEAVDRLTANRKIDTIARIAQARMVATAVHLRQDLTEHEKNAILCRWEKVTFRIYGIYKNDARLAVGEYVRLAWNIINKEMPSSKILEELSRIGRNFPVKDIIKRRTGMDCYTNWKDELRYFLFKYEEHLAKKAGQKFNNEQWIRIWESSSAKSIEHIRPQKLIDTRGKELEKGTVHRLGNLLLLPPKLNSKLQNKSAREKADSYTKTGLLIAQEVASTISESGWNLKIIKDREARLLKWAMKEWAD